MLNIATSLIIFFFAYTSLAYAGELTYSKAGRSIIILNILLYLSRTLGELMLFPEPSALIIIVCMIIAAIYSIALLGGDKKKYTQTIWLIKKIG